MLILSRRIGESIVVNDNIEIFITAIEGDQVKIGISAPSDIGIFRREVLDSIQQSNREAAKHNLDMEQFKKIMRISKINVKKD
ncbi:MAG: csrA [Bacilli bacterium]|nr:csrA [Bacilli bacterium]